MAHQPGPPAPGGPGGASGDPEEYSIERVIAAKDRLFEGGFGGAAASVQSLQRSPCAKQAVLAAGLVALLLAAHRYKEGGTRLRCVNDSVLGFLGVFQLQWYLCRKDEHDRKLAVRRFYEQQSAMQQGKMPMPVGAGAGAVAAAGGATERGTGSGSGSGEAASDAAAARGEGRSTPTSNAEEPWRRHIEQLVQYDLPSVTKGAAKDSFTMK